MTSLSLARRDSGSGSPRIRLRPRSRNSRLDDTSKSYARRYRALIYCVCVLCVIGILRLASKSALKFTPAQEATSLSEQVFTRNTPLRNKLIKQQKQPIELDPVPILREPSGRPDEQFVAYLPHSVRRRAFNHAQRLFLLQGYHNQRISLENALVLAHMLNRTLLVPPVWLGLPIPFISFDKLYYRLVQAQKTGLMHCKSMPSNLPIPQECLGGYWDYTVVSWDFLVNLDDVAATQPVVNRWDMSYDWLERTFDLDRRRDIYFVNDERLYEYRFFDSEEDKEELGKFHHRINVDALAKAAQHHRILHLGTVFGSARIRLTKPENLRFRSLARQSMVFKNELLDDIVTTISGRLGGAERRYISVHLRVGDGIFQRNAKENADKLFAKVCKKLGFSSKAIQEMQDNRSSGYLAKREGEESALGKLALKSDYPTIHTRQDSPIHESLSCRGELHTAKSGLPLNTPLYLATDSKIPASDPALRVFYDHFPCIFTLGDFSNAHPTDINAEPMQKLQDVRLLRSKEDGVGFASFFYPILDAMIAARGQDMVGTVGVSDFRCAKPRSIALSSPPFRNLQWMCCMKCITDET